MFCSVFPKPVRLKVSPQKFKSFICIRMVTRGLYPRLVRRNVKKHLDTLNAVGVENFIVEVVTVRNSFKNNFEGSQHLIICISINWSIVAYIFLIG